jgi:hypothetical protein
MRSWQDYSASQSFPYAQATLGDLELYGFVHKRKKTDGIKSDQFFPTHLATALCAGDTSASTTQSADDKRFLILETNYKIYAYTCTSCLGCSRPCTSHPVILDVGNLCLALRPHVAFGYRYWRKKTADIRQPTSSRLPS